MTKPWISVVTVVKDDSAGFRQTLASVQQQDCDGVEFVVVDSSTERDDIPEQLIDTVANYQWVEPSGIYSAMNVAVNSAVGDFVFFANAGDTFYSRSVLTDVRNHLGRGDWAFGPVEIVELSGRHVVTPQWNYEVERALGFSRGKFPAHQGTFVRREVLQSLGGFDTTYAVAADYAMALRLACHSEPVLLPFVVATFREGGTSTLQWQDSFREFHRARREILQLTGIDDWRERWHSYRHFGLVWLNRSVLSRLRGDVR